MSYFRPLARVAALLVLVVAPGSLSAQGRAVTGTYNTTINSPQGATKAVITITGDTGAYAGTLAAVTTAGNVVTLAGDTAAGPYRVVMTVTGTAAAGTITIGNESAKLKGTFTAK